MPLRPTAETMPEVTVWVKPNGLPMATTKSPTRNLLLSASLISVSLFALIRIKAMSVFCVRTEELGLEAAPIC